MILVQMIAAEWKIPYVIHMMDDWPEMMYRRGLFSGFRRKNMLIKLDELMAGAANSFGICQAMCDAYENRYGRQFLPFHNALESEDWLLKSRKNWQAGRPFQLLYSGALMPKSQLQSVFDVAHAIAALRRDGKDFVFNIYAPWYAAVRYRNDLERCDGVKVFDAPQTMEIESLFAGADLLLLPINFDDESVRYIKYSMPTKVPAYMFSGTPTLAYGPESVASVKYAKAWAYCVTDKNKNVLADAIKTLAGDEILREKLAKKAQKLAKEKHNAIKVRADFHKAFAR
jgi:glycosyltransferase involved in cell wall biosynthesis